MFSSLVSPGLEIVVISLPPGARARLRLGSHLACYSTAARKKASKFNGSLEVAVEKGICGGCLRAKPANNPHIRPLPRQIPERPFYKMDRIDYTIEQVGRNRG